MLRNHLECVEYTKKGVACQKKSTAGLDFAPQEQVSMLYISNKRCYKVIVKLKVFYPKQSCPVPSGDCLVVPFMVRQAHHDPSTSSGRPVMVSLSNHRPERVEG